MSVSQKVDYKIRPSESKRKHNESILRQLAPGDLVYFGRGLYFHWAVYIGEGKLCHIILEESGRENKDEYCSSVVPQDKAQVCIQDFWDVVGDSMAYKGNDLDETHRAFTAVDIVERAKGKLGPMKYNLLFKNCEHFAKWCRYGLEESGQSNLLMGIAKATGRYLGLLPKESDHQ